MSVRTTIWTVGLFLFCFTFCSLLQAATNFEVSPSILGFGQLPPSQPKTLSFKVSNLQQNNQLIVNVSMTGTLQFVVTVPGQNFSLPGQIIVPANDAKEVKVTYPPVPIQQCATAAATVTVKAGSEQETVLLKGELKCPELRFIGPGLQLSFQNGIKVQFGVINTGTVDSLKTNGQILLNGSLAHTFTIPPLLGNAPGNPGNQKQFEHLLTSVRSGTHTVEVRLDTINVNIEGQEDNTKSKTITIP